MDPLPQIRPITGSLALQIQEIGYGFTASRKTCRQYLEALKVVQFTPKNVAHILAMMIRTHTGLTTESYPMATISSGWPDEKGDELKTWNSEVFAEVVNEISPNCDFTEVISDLDHPGFIVKDRQGLHILTAGILKGLRGKIFPITTLYKPWNNKEEQVFRFR